MSMRRQLVFFFQAEDGIRDLIVTGVQTCALPIYPLLWSAVNGEDEQSPLPGRSPGRSKLKLGAKLISISSLRSEERRVGKSVDLGGRRIIKKKKRKEQRYLCQIHTE